MYLTVTAGLNLIIFKSCTQHKQFKTRNHLISIMIPLKLKRAGAKLILSRQKNSYPWVSFGFYKMGRDEPFHWSTRYQWRCLSAHFRGRTIAIRGGNHKYKRLVPITRRFMLPRNKLGYNLFYAGLLFSENWTFVKIISDFFSGIRKQEIFPWPQFGLYTIWLSISFFQELNFFLK